MDNEEKAAPEEAAEGALGETIEMTEESYDDIKNEAHRLARELGVSLEEAARSVHASRGTSPQAPSRMIGSLKDLSPGTVNISIRARLVTLHDAERNEGGGKYYYGMLGDSTTTVPFSAWTEFDFNVGDALLLQNVNVREWKERTEIVINDRSRTSRTDDLDGLVPSLDDGVPGTIGELVPESRRIDIECRVLEVQRGEVIVKESPKEITRGCIADRTGRMDFTCWGPVDLIRDRCYRIIGGYVKDHRGALRFNFDPGAIIRELPDDRLPPLEDLQRPLPSRIAEVNSRRSFGPVMLRGMVLDVRGGSGLIRRCSDCGRRMAKGQCPVHGRTKGEDGLSLRAIFDDGSGSAIIRAEGPIVEHLLGKRVSEVSEELKESLDPSSVTSELSSRLNGRPWTIIGDPSVDEYGISVSVKEMSEGFDIELLNSDITSLMGVLI
ncbi:MAG: hypothetical protein MUC62_03930 [Candidatus Thermoplasmatota archaeon]|jgi:replication factor A1|nr:hypothetical protein [Candidatus Thermoplasmatota archaeon]